VLDPEVLEPKVLLGWKVLPDDDDVGWVLEPEVLEPKVLLGWKVLPGNEDVERVLEPEVLEPNVLLGWAVLTGNDDELTGRVLEPEVLEAAYVLLGWAVVPVCVSADVVEIGKFVLEPVELAPDVLLG